jgi:hypothetical protein
MLLAGDADGARVALRALEDLVRLIEQRSERAGGERDPAAPAGNITSLVGARSRRQSKD